MQFLRESVVRMLESLGYATARKFSKGRMARRLPRILESARDDEMELDDVELNELLQRMIAADTVEVVSELEEIVSEDETADPSNGELKEIEATEAETEDVIGEELGLDD